MRTGCGSVWLERLVWDQEVAGSNPVTPILYVSASGSGVEHHLAKVGAAGSNPVSRFFNWAETLILEGFRFLFVSYYLYTAVDSYNAFFKMFHWLH